MAPVHKPLTGRFLHQRELPVICHPIQGGWMSLTAIREWVVCLRISETSAT